jgi:hypothetical protein
MSMESDASVNNRVEDACARDCRRTPKALFQFEQALQLLLQSGTVFRGIAEISEPCLFQWRQHDYNVLFKAYEFEGETNHLPYGPHKEKTRPPASLKPNHITARNTIRMVGIVSINARRYATFINKRLHPN